MRHHPAYTKTPLQEDLAREHFLHRLVAGSAFLFALSILPVAQYYLVGGHTGADQGQVAGVATVASPSPSSFAAVANTGGTLLECVNQKDTDQADLTKFLEGKKKALLRDYEQAVEPYRFTITQLQGTPEQINSERASLEKLIDSEYQNYLSQLNAVESAVAAQQQEIIARECPAQ
jgi:hypothetical protein